MGCSKYWVWNLTTPVCEMTHVCNMTIQQDSIPALSIPRNKVVVVEEIQLQILTLLNKYSARKCKLNYSFAIKNTKLTLDVDVLPWEENHYTVAGGRGARRRQTRRRKESGHVYQRNTPTAEAETPRNILPNARSLVHYLLIICLWLQSAATLR